MPRPAADRPRSRVLDANFRGGVRIPADPTVRHLNTFALTAACLSLWPAQAFAQGGAQAHNPISIVDTGDRLKLFGPPDYPPTVHNVPTTVIVLGCTPRLTNQFATGSMSRK